MNKLIQKLTTKQLTDELTRRILSDEVRFDTEWTKTYYGDDSTEVIYALKWKDGEKNVEWEVQSLLEKQHERDKQKRLENFRKDNAREDVWKKIEEQMNFTYIKLDSGAVVLTCKKCDERVNIYFVHTSPFLKENLSNLKDCLSLSKLEEIYSKHQHGVAYDDRGKWYDKFDELITDEDVLKFKKDGTWKEKGMDKLE